MKNVFLVFLAFLSTIVFAAECDSVYKIKTFNYNNKEWVGLIEQGYTWYGGPRDANVISMVEKDEILNNKVPIVAGGTPLIANASETISNSKDMELYSDKIAYKYFSYFCNWDRNAFDGCNDDDGIHVYCAKDNVSIDIYHVTMTCNDGKVSAVCTKGRGDIYTEDDPVYPQCSYFLGL